MAISIFRYPGGKSRKSVREKILSKAPSSFSEYRDPFVGGGGIFWTINSSVKRWINDKDEDLISVYLALRDRPDDFIKKCREIPPSNKKEALMATKEGGRAIYNARLGEKFNELLKDDSDKALKYFFINRTVFGGRVNYNIPSRLYYSNPNGWNITVKKNTLESAALKMKDVKVTNEDYSALLDTEGDDVWVYLDPPYLKNTNLAESSQLYRHNFTKEDHEMLSIKCEECKHKILISYDDDKEGFIRSLYSNSRFRIFSESWKYSGTTNSQKEDGKELIITNYDV